MLIYHLNGGFPLGFEMGKKDEFNNKVLAKLPLEMQKQLKRYIFDEDDEDTDRRLYYSLLKGESLAMYQLGGYLLYDYQHFISY